MNIPLVISSESVSLDNFWRALLVYHDRPHLVNRKLAAVEQKFFAQVIFLGDCNIFGALTKHAVLHEVRKRGLSGDSLKNLLENLYVSIKETSFDHFLGRDEGIFVSGRFLIGRNNTKCAEIAVFDKDDNRATFLAAQEATVFLAPPFSYHIQLKGGNFRILLDNFDDADTSSAQWLADKLFPKIIKWFSDESQSVKSLSLICPEKYCQKYSDLKQKYAESLLENWTDKTDPKKFVFEDIAIASYLICLWQDQEVNFVDIGCGNGLLVHLLNKEGYKGFGIDLRERKLWKIYPETTKLTVGTIGPDSVFPGTTWIIGNHSDELTPWIPIIALRSNSNFFVLPCCPYDFNGQKYIRINTSVSQYSDYLSYIQNISETCNFHVDIDKLRIPSTKRTCLIGYNKPNNNYTENIEKFIDTRMKTQFKPRESVELVRNCTKIDGNLIKKVIGEIVHIILETDNFLNHWNKGGVVKLSELSKRIDLKLLKNQCGGLQTLLKNHRYLFQLENGMVSLRKPMELTETDKYKGKPCWFLENHPNGCLYDANTCAYLH